MSVYEAERGKCETERRLSVAVHVTDCVGYANVDICVCDIVIRMCVRVCSSWVQQRACVTRDKAYKIILKRVQGTSADASA